MYARPGHARRMSGVSGNTAGRHLPGYDSRIGRAYRRDRREAVDRICDCKRSRRGIVGAGETEHFAVGGSNPLSPRSVFGIALRAGGVRDGACRWIAGGFGRQPLSTDGTGARVFVDGRRSIGHAAKSRPGADRGRDCEFYSRKGTRRLDLSARRGKEVAENQQSNRSGTADPLDTAIVACDRNGRAPDEQNTSGYADIPGAAHGGERRAGGVGSIARGRAGFPKRRRTNGGSLVHVARRSKSEAELSGAGARGASGNPHQARAQAIVRGNKRQPSFAERQAPFIGDEVIESK